MSTTPVTPATTSSAGSRSNEQLARADERGDAVADLGVDRRRQATA
jgi:hypothetical protein